ncbi:MAG: DUF6807 family protein [Planctomycetota bacterium]
MNGPGYEHGHGRDHDPGREKRPRGLLVPALLTLVLLSCSTIPDTTIGFLDVKVAAPSRDVDVPLASPIELPSLLSGIPLEEISITLQESGGSGSTVPGQLELDKEGEPRLWCVLPHTDGDRAQPWRVLLSLEPDANGFVWRDGPEGSRDLYLGERRVLRYACAFDASTPERLEATYKPYHHAFDATGENLLTKGTGGLYSHHRGIFIGWNRLTFEGREVDSWHMRGITQRHRAVLMEVTGPVLARSKVLVDWTLDDGRTVIAEQREVTVYRQSAPRVLLLDFNTRLAAPNGAVLLNGDAEHGGFQFRAHNDVAGRDAASEDNATRAGPNAPAAGAVVAGQGKASYIFPADGIDPTKVVDLPWVAMTYELNGRRYTVQHMNHPGNPKNTLYSAYRDYGRFGAFFVHEISKGETLELRYRIRITEGETPAREDFEAAYASFVSPPTFQDLPAP